MLREEKLRNHPRRSALHSTIIATLVMIIHDSRCSFAETIVKDEFDEVIFLRIMVLFVLCWCCLFGGMLGLTYIDITLHPRIRSELGSEI